MIVASGHSIWLGIRDLLWTDAIAGATVAVALAAVGVGLALHAVWRRRSRRAPDRVASGGVRP